MYSLGRLKWILDIIWPFNQHFNLKNQRNWIKQVLMIIFFEWYQLHLTALTKENYFRYILLSKTVRTCFDLCFNTLIKAKWISRLLFKDRIRCQSNHAAKTDVLRFSILPLPMYLIFLDKFHSVFNGNLGIYSMWESMNSSSNKQSEKAINSYLDSF